MDGSGGGSHGTEPQQATADLQRAAPWQAGNPTRGRILLCIDDYGLRPGVDAAVLSLFEQRLANATSCMVGSARWRAAAAPLRDRTRAQAGIDLGLHLDFTHAPFDSSLRCDLPTFMARAYLRRLPTARVRHEIRAQLDAFEDALGRPPDHVDGHQHVHQLPQVRELLVEELVRRGQRPWLRSTGVRAGTPGVKARVIAFTGDRGLRRLALRHGFGMNARLLGVYGFDGGPTAYTRRLMQWLSVARPGDLLMCHAGWREQDEAAMHDDPIARARHSEYEVLTRRLHGLLLAHGLTLW